MKNFLLFTFVLLSYSISAQDFEVTPNPIVDWEVVSDTEVVGKAKVKNNSTVLKQYVWERTVMNDCNNDQTWFCDPNLCYIPSVSTQTFALEPGAEGPFELHATFTDMEHRDLVVQIKVYEAGNETNVIDAMYEFVSGNCIGVDVKDVELKDIKLFPNPATDYFTLTSIGNVRDVIIHNIIGTPLKQYIAEEGAHYSISDLPSGVYMVQLVDTDGNNVGSKRVYKH